NGIHGGGRGDQNPRAVPKGARCIERLVEAPRGPKKSRADGGGGRPSARENFFQQHHRPSRSSPFRAVGRSRGDLHYAGRKRGPSFLIAGNHATTKSKT